MHFWRKKTSTNVKCTTPPYHPNSLHTFSSREEKELGKNRVFKISLGLAENGFSCKHIKQQALTKGLFTLEMLRAQAKWILIDDVAQRQTGNIWKPLTAQGLKRQEKHKVLWDPVKKGAVVRDYMEEFNSCSHAVTARGAGSASQEGSKQNKRQCGTVAGQRNITRYHCQHLDYAAEETNKWSL